jgi:hypothetical protein
VRFEAAVKRRFHGVAIVARGGFLSQQQYRLLIGGSA